MGCNLPSDGVFVLPTNGFESAGFILDSLSRSVARVLHEPEPNARVAEEAHAERRG